MKPILCSAAEAVAHIPSHSVLAVGGAGAGHAVPDRLLQALGERFAESQAPHGLTVIHPCGIGDNDTRGLNHLAQPGLVARDIGGFWGNAPKMAALAQAGHITGYNLPQGVLQHLMRAAAGNEDGLLTKTGLHTFVDPRYEGGKINAQTTEDLVQLVELNGQEYLFYRTVRPNVAFIRGSSIDVEGNLTMEEEVGTFSMLALAQAAKGNGGLVIAQVKRTREDHAAPAQVKVPAMLIDYVVVEPEQGMTFLSPHEPAFVSRTAPYQAEKLALEGIKRVITQRAALELRPGQRVNLGYGMPDGVPIVAREKGLLKQLTFMIEQGQIDGVISTGLDFGAMYNPAAILDDGYQFDQFHGGILDICFLGFAQIDRHGHVNASRFGNRLTGCGGFIDISQHAKKVVFCGGFAAKSEVEVREEGLHISQPGRFRKFVGDVQQITLNGRYAAKKGQEVLYVTERAVFRLTEQGPLLIEIAPGADLQRDILALMDFEPLIADEVKPMPLSCFSHPKTTA
jgi:propionate CoA-transferase